MKKTKKIGLFLVVALLMTTVTGCVQFEIGMELNSDNTGKITAMTAMNPDMFGEGEEPDTNIGLVNESLGAQDGVKVVKSPVSYEVDGSTYKGEKVEISFNDTAAYLNASNEGEIKLIDLSDGNKRLEFYFSEDLDGNEDVDSNPEEVASMFSMIKATGGKIVFTIKTDYNVVNHNASKVENGVYTWDLLDIMQEPDKIKDALFIEYDPVNRPTEIKPELKEKTRKGVETWVGKDKKSKDFHGNALAKLGILKGTNKGLELEKELTRAEGAIMYARLLGAEDKVEQFAKTNPNYKSGFTDVPVWAEPTMNYLHYKGLVAGIGNNKYGSNDKMTEAQYATLVLRALGYTDFEWSTAHTKVKDLGLYKEDAISSTDVLSDKFTRNGMAYISYNALFFKNVDTGEILIDKVVK